MKPLSSFFTPQAHGLVCLVFALCCTPRAQALPLIKEVPYQPFVAATQRLVEALAFCGAPLEAEDAAAIQRAIRRDPSPQTCDALQNILDRYCVVGVHINPESRVKVAEGSAKKELMQQGWRTFLVKVHNEAGITPHLLATSPNAAPSYRRSSGKSRPVSTIAASDVAQRFLTLATIDRQPMKAQLSGLILEYRILQIYSRDQGPREAKLAFNVGQGTQDIGFRNAVSILFQCVPAVQVMIDVLDEKGDPTMAAFTFRDRWGRIYPNPARRVAPDFFFHNQVYRAQGESVTLPPGDYSVTVTRGPEYLEQTYELTVAPDAPRQTFAARLERWIQPAERGWISGDHHIHAAGCSHYENPTEGVTPEDMMRHVLGEDLKVGCVLTWGPCWYAQKEFFEGKVSALSQPDYLMRYDVEVSGFPSSHAGHLCLLRLREDDFPGTTEIEEWPSWTLPVLAWGKEQGGVVGYSHSGWGLALPDTLPSGERKFVGALWGGAPEGWEGRAADQLPDYAMPRFDGIGANEYIVTVTHNVCDFISAVDTPVIWELNIWYHALNCGFRTRISGETDFPCIYDERVGLGRAYVKLDEKEPLNFDTWIEELKRGRSYCGDGKSHVFDFKVDDVEVGQVSADGTISQLTLKEGRSVSITCDFAALLAKEPTEETERIRKSRLDAKPYWHIERARLGDSRKVPVELIVNGAVVATKTVEADGVTRALAFDVPIRQSSWVALRVLPSVHTNPIFVEVGGKAIRANLKSAEWCRKAVDVCWNAKHGKIRDADQDAAKKAYQHARDVYDRIIAESQ